MKIDVIGILGLLVSIAGFSLSLWQMKRTRLAAEAANIAATEAVQALKHVNSVASAQDICGRSRSLLDLARSKKLKAAAQAAFDLRDLVARLHATEAGRLLSTVENWQAILLKIGNTHDQLESAAMMNRIDVIEHAAIIHSISQLHTEFSSISASTTDSGAKNANT